MEEEGIYTSSINMYYPSHSNGLDPEQHLAMIRYSVQTMYARTLSSYMAVNLRHKLGLTVAPKRKL